MNKQSINLADCSWPYLHIWVKKALSHINFNLFSWMSIIHSFNHSLIHCTISWVSTATQTLLKVLPHKSIENNPLMTVPFTVCWWERRTCGSDQCQKKKKKEWGYSYIDAHTHIIKLCLSKVLFIILLITLKYTTRKQVTHKIKTGQNACTGRGGTYIVSSMVEHLLAINSCWRRKRLFFRHATPERLFTLQ